MNQNEYFIISKKEKLQKRCPILDICERRWATIYFFSFYPEGEKHTTRFEYLKKMGEIGIDFEYNSLVTMRGEISRFSKWFDGVSFKNMCPEVSLFDETHQITGLGSLAYTSADYDFGKDVRNSLFRHFSECPEFCAWNFSKEKKNKTSQRRSGLSKKIKFEIMHRDNFTCQYCGKTKDDGVTLHIDHKIPVSKGGTDKFDNLVTACSECNFGKSNKII